MIYLSKNRYWKINKDYNIDKTLYLLIDRPSYINNYNNFIWYNNKLHREYDLPAYVYNDGFLIWCKNNNFIKEKHLNIYENIL